MLDEPTAALGVAQTAEVLNLIERVRDRGLGVIMISHNMEDVRAVADRIVVLRLGRNNGVFYPDTSNQELVSAITGAADNSVRAGRARRQRRRGGTRMSVDTKPARALDRADTRVRHDEGLGGAIRGFVDRVRSGDLGSLPVVVGLAVIWTVFQTPQPGVPVGQQPRQPAVRLLHRRRHLARHRVHPDGRRDRPVGRLRVGLRLRAGRRAVGQRRLAGAGAILVALLAAPSIGAVYAVLFNRLGMPSFVSTLAGLLAVLGLQLYILGASGSINLPYGSPLVSLGQTW